MDRSKETKKQKIIEALDSMTMIKTEDGQSIILNDGATASKIGKELGIARNVISQELNKLCEEDKALKIKSRPVLFYSKAVIEGVILQEVRKNVWASKEELIDFLNTIIRKNNQIKEDVFSRLIGFEGSLKPCIKKAKSAVVYPPNGLHLMLSGESGVGKTLFAETLHEYFERKTNQKVPFVYFNCSEYFNNPELLTSHLFGHKQGSFTGATSDKEGLIDKAHGGFLFLDEVHRLPHEGQEKLFTLLDKGYFTPLGGGELKKATIRFIFATTESLKETFLKTFLRRIPVTIHMPSLNERPIEEKIQLVKMFFSQESHRVKENIYISQNVIKQLVFRDYEGNVGELKSDIQFLCAQSYLEGTSSAEKSLTIDQHTLHFDAQPLDIKVKDQLIFNEWVDRAGVTIYCDDYAAGAIERKNYEEKQRSHDIFYNFIIDEFSNVKDLQLSVRDKESILQAKIDLLFDMKLFQEENLEAASFHYEKDFLKKMDNLIDFIEKEFSLPLSDTMRYNLTHHLYTIMLMEDKDDFFDYISSFLLGKTENFASAKKIVNYAQNLFQLKLPSTEVIYFDLFLRFLNQRELDDDRISCGVVVIAHGETTATSMVEYTNLLFSNDVMEAVDMPINQSVEETLERLRRLIKRKRYKKLILMVDIGSLVYFGNVISEEFGIEVLLISNINLLTLLEVAREVIYESTNFDYLLPVLLDKNHKVSLCKKGQFYDAKVLIISCLTGVGTALKVERFIVDTFPKEVLSNIRIITLEKKDMTNIEKIHEHIFPDEKIIGVIGTYKLEIPDIPYIGLEDLFSDRGVEILLTLFGYDLQKESTQKLLKDVSKNYIHTLSMEAIINHLTILNPQRITIELGKVFKEICVQLNLAEDEKKMLRFIIHCACVFEKLILNSENQTFSYNLSYSDLPREASVIKMSFRTLEVSYNVQLSPLEIKYIYELLFD